MFNGQLYLQEDGIAMGSTLGPVIAGIFMVELERNLLPTLSQYMTSFKRYVDETISYVKADCIENVLNTLNSFLTVNKHIMTSSYTGEPFIPEAWKCDTLKTYFFRALAIYKESL